MFDVWSNILIVFFRSLKTRELSFAQFGNFLRLLEESVFIFQFLNGKIHNYVKQNIIVNFIIQKLKNKHTFLKKPQKVAKLSKVATFWGQTEQSDNFLRLFEESVFIFQFLDDKIHNYVKQTIIVNLSSTLSSKSCQTEQS